MKQLSSRWIDLVERYRNNEFARKLVTVMGFDLLAKASGFLLIPVYLRLMTQEEYGAYNFLVSIIQMLGLLLTLGLYIPQVKLYHTLVSKKERGQLLFTIFVSLLLLSLLVILPFYALGFDFKLSGVLISDPVLYRKYRFIILLAVVVTMLGYLLTYFLFTTERTKQIRNYNIWRMVFVGLTVLAMVFFRDDAIETRLLMTFLAEFILILFFGAYFIRETVMDFSIPLLFRCLVLGLPIMFTNLFTIILNFSDKFFLEKYSALSNLSTYYLAFAFASVLPLVSASLQNVWMPMFMKEASLERNSKNTKMLIRRLWMALLALGFFVWLIFLFLLQTGIVPSTYREGLSILPVLLLSQILMAVSTLLNNYLVYFEKTYLIFFCGLVVSVLSLVMGRIIIPQWGMSGAAFTLLLSNLVYLFICNYLVQMSKRKFFRKTKTGDELVVNPVS